MPPVHLKRGLAIGRNDSVVWILVLKQLYDLSMHHKWRIPTPEDNSLLLVVYLKDLVLFVTGHISLGWGRAALQILPHLRT